MDAAINIANVGSHNARAAQIRRFVAVPPKRATTLRLVTAEDPPQQLGEWDVTTAQNNNSLSIEISATLEEHTATVQRATEAILAWTVGDKTTVSSKRLRARYTPPPDEDEDGESDQLRLDALGINGTTVGQVIQMQRHLEIRERSSNTFVQGLMNTAMQLNSQLQAQLQDSYTRIHELQQQQIDAAAAVVDDYAEQAELAGTPVAVEVDSGTAARTQALEVVTGIVQQYGPTLIQVALARLTSPKAPIQITPPALPPSSSAPPTPPTPPPSPVAPAAPAAAAPAPPAASSVASTAPPAPPRRTTRAQRVLTRPGRPAPKRGK